MQILPQLMITLSVIVLFSIPSLAKDYVVTNTNSKGPGSLTQAIEDLNKTGDKETNRIIFKIPPADESTITSQIPRIKNPVTFENGSGQNVIANNSRIRPFYTYGIYADNSFGIDNISGSVGGTGVGLFYGKGNGIYADQNIDITTLEGQVHGTGIAVGLFGAYASGSGLSAGHDITIGTLSGDVSGTAWSGAGGLFAGIGFASAYGLAAGNDINISTLSGNVSTNEGAIGLGVGPVLGIGGAYASAYGLYGGNNINIGYLSGNVSASAISGAVGIAFGVPDFPVAIGIGGVYVPVYGLFATKGIKIGSLSGTVSATGGAGGAVSSYLSLTKVGNPGLRGMDRLRNVGNGSPGGKGIIEAISISTDAVISSATGLSAGSDININTLSGNVSATGLAIEAGGYYSSNMGIGGQAGQSDTNREVSRYHKVYGGDGGIGVAGITAVNLNIVSASATGLSAGSDININTLSGNVSATGLAIGAGGYYSSNTGVGGQGGKSISKHRRHGIGYGPGGNGGLGFGWGESLSVDIVSASATGLSAGSDININTLSGNVSATGLAIGAGGYYSSHTGVGGIPGIDKKLIAEYGSGINYGLNVNILIENASSSGIYTGNDIRIGSLSGNVRGSATAIGAGLIGVGIASGYGLYAKNNIAVGVLTGTVKGQGKTFGGIIGAGSASAYGLYAGKDINIGIVSGEVKAQSTNYWLRVPFLGNNAYGIYAKGSLNGGKAYQPLFITGKVSAKASGDAVAIQADEAMNVHVTGSLIGKDTSWFSWLWDDGYAIKGGAGDDIVSLDTGATIIGKIDLGQGVNTLNLYGSNSLNSYVKNVNDLNIGDGIRNAYWSIGKENQGFRFDHARVNTCGIFEVNTFIIGNIDISRDAILTGNGKVNGNVVNTGILMPYNRETSIGQNNTFTIYGNYTHEPDAIFMVRANAAGQADRLYVRSYLGEQEERFSSGEQGIAKLKGGTVSVLADNGLYKQHTKYTIVSAEKVEGTFGAVETDLAFLDSSLSYGSEKAYLTLTRNNTTYTDVAQSSTQKKIASLFDMAQRDKGKLPTFSNIMNNLNSMSVKGAKHAYDQMAGHSHSSTATASFAEFNQYTDVMKRRMRSFVSDSPSPVFTPVAPIDSANTIFNVGSALVCALNASQAKTTPVRRWGLFAEEYGAEFEGRMPGDDFAHYNHTNNGYLIGFDTQLTPSTLAGATVGSSYARVGLKGLNEQAYTNGYQSSLYGVYTQEDFYLNGILGYSYNDYLAKRHITFVVFNAIAEARYEEHLVSGYTEAGYKVPLKYGTITPFTALQANYLIRDGFSEAGADAIGLNVDRRNYSSVLSSVGVRYKKAIAIGKNGTLTPKMSLHWEHEFSNDDYGFTAALVGIRESSFSMNLDRSAKDQFTAGLSVTHEMENLSFQFSCESSFSATESLHKASLGLRYCW